MSGRCCARASSKSPWITASSGSSAGSTVRRCCVSVKHSFTDGFTDGFAAARRVRCAPIHQADTGTPAMGERRLASGSNWSPRGSVPHRSSELPITCLPITCLPITCLPITCLPITCLPMSRRHQTFVHASIGRAHSCRASSVRFSAAATRLAQSHTPSPQEHSGVSAIPMQLAFNHASNHASNHAPAPSALRRRSWRSSSGAAIAGQPAPSTAGSDRFHHGGTRRESTAAAVRACIPQILCETVFHQPVVHRPAFSRGSPS